MFAGRLSMTSLIRSAFELAHPCCGHTGSCPHFKITSFPAKRSCIQLAAKIRTLYSARNAPRQTTIEHSIWNALPTLPFQCSDFSRLTHPPTPHPERRPCRLAMLSVNRRYTRAQPCLPLPPIAPAIPGSLPRAADTTTLALRHGDLDWICEDK
ncbi:hypothetical protein B0H14DRAFT_3624235 [Mycena olivaceomarginata]|nr:hypothetical protein B0H14DRAFT_3624235 [Mycena olivaceomarginata]